MRTVPQELSQDPRVRYDAASARVLYPVSLLVGVMFAVLALLHPIMVAGSNGRILAAIAAASAALMAGFAWRWRGRESIAQAPLYLAVVFLVLILNATVHLYLTHEEWQSTNLMLVTIAIGMAVLQTRWYLALTALAWLGWIIGVTNAEDVNWPHWAIAMVLATLIGALMREARRNSLDQAAETMAQQRSMLEEAQNLAETRQDLLATVSHDVRTPVTGIVGMVDLLLERPLDARTRELVVGVQNSAAGLTTLLNNLLDLARVEAGRLELNPTDTNLELLIDEVLQMVGPLAQRKHVPLVGALHPECMGWIHADGSRLKQILLNLVSNAVKFTEHGAVTVVAKPTTISRQRYVDVAVTDTGPGMGAAELETIFDAFVQGQPSVYRRHGGAGLGLAIAQRLTTAMGGELTVTSTEGLGTTFHVLLPAGTLAEEHSDDPPKAAGQVVVSGDPIAVEAVAMAMRRFGKEVIPECLGTPDTLHVRVVSDTSESEATRPRDDEHRLVILGPTVTVAASPTAGEYLPLPWTRERMLETLGIALPETAVDRVLALPTGLRVLLAEDDATNRSLIAEMLRRMGATVSTVSDGAAAVEEVARGAFDTVLLDLNMPVMDGLEAVRVIRERLATVDDLAVLALTADPGWMDRSVLMAAGFNGYVLKPTTRRELQIGITKALERLPGEVAIGAQVPVANAVSLDTGVLGSLCEDLGDVGLVSQAMEVYLEELPNRLVQLHQGIESGSAEQVRSTAHALKGASGMLGAIRLQQLCQQLETTPDQSLLFDVIGEAERVETKMREYLRSAAVEA